MYTERAAQRRHPGESHYTDRQECLSPSTSPARKLQTKLTDNSNFFALGPSVVPGNPSIMNSVVRQLHEQGTNIVMVDTGNSYEVVRVSGRQVHQLHEERPITMNPFRIRKEADERGKRPASKESCPADLEARREQ